jgi:cell division protein FtsI (penicillin-binding protein 3)
MIVWRHYLLVFVFMSMVAALCGRIVYLAVTDRAFLQNQGDARSIRKESIPAMRGVIYDRQGEPLAVSTPVFAVWTDPSKATLTGAELKRLAVLIDVPESSLKQKLRNHSNKEFVYLKRRASWQMAEQLRALKLEHIYLQPEYLRYYPAAETTAHLVGVTNIDDQGIEGSEYAFEQQLRGEHGGKVVLKDLHGSTIRDLEYVSAPVYGTDLNLSIDLRLQYLAYRELKSAVASHDAQSGSLVMLDANNGEVLALVNQPSYNPNDIQAQQTGMRNRALTDTYEPGSTIKPFAALAALESGRYDRHTQIDTSPGYFSVGRKLIADPSNLAVVSLARSLQKSSQVAFAKVALDLQEQAVFGVLRRAGLGDFIGTGLPGEGLGLLDDSQLRYPIVRASLAYGYGLSVTPLQLAHAYLSLATLGEKIPVSILKTDRRVVPRERVFDKRVVQEVLAMMEGVTVKDGTGTAAAVDGYRVAGKTGTARVVGPQGYDDQRHVAWFAGIVPVSKPRLVMVVVVNEPKAGLYGGGLVAAPLFGRVAERSLRLLGVPPDAQFAETVTARGPAKLAAKVRG